MFCMRVCACLGWKEYFRYSLQYLGLFLCTCILKFYLFKNPSLFKTTEQNNHVTRQYTSYTGHRVQQSIICNTLLLGLYDFIFFSIDNRKDCLDSPYQRPSLSIFFTTL